MKLEFLLFFSSNIQKVTLDIVFIGMSIGENKMSESLSYNIKTEKRFLRIGVAS